MRTATGKLIEEMRYEACYLQVSEGMHPVKAWAWVLVAMLLVLLGALRCALTKHEWVDEDPGNPEVGPQPEVHCKRCGRSV